LKGVGKIYLTQELPHVNSCPLMAGRLAAKVDEMHDCAASACGLPDCDRKCTLDNSHAFELHHTDENSKLVTDNGKRVDPSELVQMSDGTLAHYFPGYGRVLRPQRQPFVSS
jgi:hypothetical protein